MVHKLITCAAGKDIDILEYSLALINKYLNPNSILIVVPDHDFERARHVLNIAKEPNICIKCDSSFISLTESCYIKDILSRNGFPYMYGWYVQQFIKIKAASLTHPNSNVLIWDSDTIPLRPLSFFDDNGSINCFVSSEYHEPYFDTLNSLLGINKLTPYSFIAQSIPLTTTIAHELILSLGGEESWIKNVMVNLSVNSPYSFSEYEVIGNFILAHKIKSINFVHAPWLRDGKKYFYKYKTLPDAVNHLKFHYCFCAFEGIGDSYIRHFLKKIYLFLKNHLKFRMLGSILSR